MSIKDEFSKFKQKQQFIKLEDGDVFEAVFIGAKFVEEGYYGKPQMVYKFNVDGEEKTFTSGSQKLFKQMHKVEEGDKIRMVVAGENKDRTYGVKIVGTGESTETTEPEEKVDDDDTPKKDTPF